MKPEKLKQLLTALEQGELSSGTVFEKLRNLSFEDAEVALIDHHRELRQGAPEVIYGAGKTLAQLKTIVERILAHGSNLLVTRIDAENGKALHDTFPGTDYDPLGRTLSLVREDSIRYPGRVAVICAGTSDLPVAREALTTAKVLGYAGEEITDVGVAGLHRLLAKSQQLHEADVLIVVAGMEGALPSVIGGLTAAPIIAVPTSVGYGTSFGGVAALLAMLNSCASGVTVVNIDNGFGAAFAAHRILYARRELNP
ncbi:MAG: 1-(5-phosphoribosyl)-5-amino-4-imidazole-carboxylate carboxylase [Desulfuromonas sp.]|nr:MAG: 1-(5-phosphoribosyl)-5-amino-4-imidazole-carboxylate carboxylase [Desulfuromonas sp.]